MTPLEDEDTQMAEGDLSAAPPAEPTAEGVVIGGPDRRARTLPEMHFAASLRGCAKCGAPPKDLTVSANGDRRTLRGTCVFCGTPSSFTFFVEGDPEKAPAPPHELGDARPSAIVRPPELALELNRLKELGIDESTRDRALTCIVELLKDPDLSASPPASMIEERDRWLAEAASQAPAPPPPPAAATAPSIDSIARALFVSGEPPATVGELETALGIRLELDGDRLKACSTGRLVLELSGLVTNLVVRYAFDASGDKPVGSVEELRTKKLLDLLVTFSSGAFETQRLLVERFGPPSILPSHHLYGGTWCFATRETAFILSRYAPRPAQSAPPVAPAPGPAVAAPAAGPSPRYLAEHFIMPKFLRERGASACLAAIEKKDDAFFIPVWFGAGMRFSPKFIYAVHGPHRVGIMTFPKPREATEAYLGILVGRVDDPSALRYFLWEESQSVTGEKGTMIGERDGATHRNYGGGPAFSGNFQADIDELTRRILALCEKPT